MNAELRSDLIDLEFLLIGKLRPTFLAISPDINDKEDDTDEIRIVLSCAQFANKSIQERISIIFKLTEEYLPAIIKERLLIIEAYSNAEMDQVLDDIFSRELF